MENTLRTTRLTSTHIVVLSFLFLTLAWGSSFILIKRGLVAYTPPQLAGIRISAAMFALLGLSIKHIRLVPREKLKYLFLSGTFGLFIPSFLFAYAQLGVSSSVAGVLNAFTPCMTFILGITFFRQKAAKMQVLGLLMGFIGAVLLILINPKGELNFNSYGLFVIAATVLYAMNLNIVKRYLPDVKALHLTTVSIFMAGVLAFVFLLVTQWNMPLPHSEQTWMSFLSIVFLGLFSTALGHIFFNRMLQMTSAVVASSITYFLPIVAVMWGVLDGEILTIWHYFSMVFIVAGVVILNRFKP